MGGSENNNISTVAECTGVLNEDDIETNDGGLNKNIVPLKHANERTYKLIWPRIIAMIFAYMLAIYGIYLVFTSAKILTTIYATILLYAGGLGVTAGAHRLWTHRSYKAKLPLRVLLLILNTMAYGMPIIDWARDHRVHHRYSETDADPYNAKRGFFFSHVGWLLCEKHPENIAKRNEMDVSDLESDPLLRFQTKYYDILMPIAAFILPLCTPILLWDETLVNAVCIVDFLRWVIFKNATSSVNSFAHIYGSHRYDKSITAADLKGVAIAAMGEGWHNYHHAFPWDYKTSELGLYKFNYTVCFIDFMAKIGWAYDLKTVSPEMIKRRVQRTGDGTHWKYGRANKNSTDMQNNNLLNAPSNNKTD